MHKSGSLKLLFALALGLAPMVAGPALASPQAAQPGSTNPGFDAKVTAAKGAMMSDPGVALSNARAAIAIGQSMSGPEQVTAVATGQWLEGESLVRLNRVELAVPVIDGALAAIARSQPGTKLHADLLKSKAAIFGMTGDIQSALGNLHRAHRIYGRLGEARSQAIVFQNIGSIYSEAHDYPRVLYYYDLANETFADDPNLALSSRNNRGNAYKEMGKFADALKEYGIALRIAREIESPLLEARIMTNIASAHYLSGNLKAADAQAMAGLRRATGDAVEWQPYLWGVRAQVALKRGQHAAALGHIERTFAGTDLTTTSTFYRDFHDTARAIYEFAGRPDMALAHLKAFKRLADESYKLAASTQSALMAVQFDTANQELRISKLKAAKLADEVKLARSNQKLQTVTFLGLLGAAAALAIIIAVSIAFAAARRARRIVADANARLTHSAYHDGLTNMSNRGHLRQLLGAAIDQANDTQQGCAVFLIDLDRFKAVNDTLGHQAGDAVLVAVAERLEALTAGRGCAGRLGGDEFGVFLPFADLDNEPSDFANQVIAALSEPIDIDGRMVSVGATVGMAAFPLDAKTVDQVTRCADLALYHAKEAGRGRYAKYAEYMQTEIDERRQLETDLREAIGDNQLAIAYQPIVDAATTEVVAYEALLRWEHPTRGDISPAVFVPIAEETKLIGEIGKWVLRTACAEAATWPDHVKLAVNLSAIQIEGIDLTGNVVHALAAHGLTTDRLELEVTESVFLRRGPNTDATLARLQALGISLALDDFGTGFSSLAYLQRASFSKIKIDRSFVQSAAEGRQESLSIIRAIVALAQGLGMDTTAEGVESVEQMDLMRTLGCTQFQGFYFGRPEISQRDTSVPATEPVPTLAARRRAVRRAG